LATASKKKIPDALPKEIMYRSKAALNGMPSFPIAQSSALCLDAMTGTMDVVELWDQKRHTVSQRAGLSMFERDGVALANLDDMDNIINFWDAASGELLSTLTGHTNWVNSVAYSPDGRTLASGSNDNTIKLWDSASGQLLRTLTGHTNYVQSVAFSADGRTLASGSFDTTIMLWDVSKANEASK